MAGIADRRIDQPSCGVGYFELALELRTEREPPPDVDTVSITLVLIDDVVGIEFHTRETALGMGHVPVPEMSARVSQPPPGGVGLTPTAAASPPIRQWR